METIQKTATILAIDDMPLNLKTLSLMLEKEGFRVLSATNGIDGIALAKQESPDLILLDLIMPDEDGFAVMQKLKSEEGLGHIPVIFLTAESDVSTKVKGFELGAVDYVVKPFKAEEVKARIRLHIRLAMTTRALLEQQTEKLKTLEQAQRSLLIRPEELPEAGFDIYFRPLHEVGGDFYEVIKLAEGIYGYFICDVAGHDLGSSLITAYAKALLKANCNIYSDPAESMMMINKVLCGVLKSGQYLTASYIVLNRVAGYVSLVNMGHPPIIHVPINGLPQVVKQKGTFLGIFPEAYYTTLKFKIDKDDLLVLYTDGLVEYSDNDSEGYKRDINRVLRGIQAINNEELLNCAEAIFKASCPKEDRIADDVLVMTIKV